MRALIDIDLDTKLEDIPEGPPCFCGKKTRKAYVEHICIGENVLVRAKKTPGYRCDHCGIEFLSKKGVSESLEKASKIMREKGDNITPVHFGAAMVNLNKSTA